LAKKRQINKISEGHLKAPDFGSNLTTTQTEMADCKARQSKKICGFNKRSIYESFTYCAVRIGRKTIILLYSRCG